VQSSWHFEDLDADIVPNNRLGLTNDQMKVRDIKKVILKTINPRSSMAVYSNSFSPMQDSIRPTSPTSMILRHWEILAQIVVGKSNKWIARNYGHGRHLIHEV
jgi:DNA-binding NarL/FixJ family response regulator